MSKSLIFAVMAGLFSMHASLAQELRIGLLNTTTGGGAVIGKHVENGWKLGLAHQGWEKDGDKLGGVPTRIFYGDDQAKTDVALREVEKMLKSDKVHIVAGIIWSNVMMTVARPVLEAKVVLLGTNAGPSPLAGEECSPLFISTSWQNDDGHQAGGALMQNDGIKSIVVMVPNYQAGKDAIAGMSRFYKGKILDQIFYKLGETDFQADLSKIRAIKPEAVYLLAPGAMGISFMKQWASAGLNKEVKLYSGFTIDYSTLPAIGDAAVGSVHAQMWDPQSTSPANQRFVKDYLAKFGGMPSDFALQAYDAPGLIAAGVKAVGGKVDDAAALVLAMRKNGLMSVRGNVRYNVNGFPIQPFYKRTVVAGSSGQPLIVGGEKILEQKDFYWERCPVDKRAG